MPHSQAHACPPAPTGSCMPPCTHRLMHAPLHSQAHACPPALTGSCMPPCTHRLMHAPLAAMDASLESTGRPRPVVVFILDALDEADHQGKGPAAVWMLVANR